MAIPLKNSIFEEIKQHGSLTDVELSKALIKNGFVIAEDRFNKLLLDLEIMGLIKVSWINKDKRRIEIVAAKEEDEVDAQNKAMMEKDYEAGFPGVENN
ncbi:MAG: hypothetical protein IH841_04630 [Thaumarchaeota archaeon]|nr:hypothetical protein [Nitrososphaerota archaeon]